MRWMPPSPQRLFDATDATWPAVEFIDAPPFCLRRGGNGGQRVSSATLIADTASPHDIAAAAAAQAALGQDPLFMIRDGDDALDATLETMGYRIKDPVTLYACAPAQLAAADSPELSAIICAKPIARQREIWAEGGIGAARLAVMARAKGARAYILARQNDRPVGAGFVACDGDIAMLHALEIHRDMRNCGAGRAASIGAARWALAQGAATFALMTTDDNAAANALYRGLGMLAVARYHYRIGPSP